MSVWKRMLTAVLALVMVIGMVPGVALAAEFALVSNVEYEVVELESNSFFAAPRSYNPPLKCDNAQQWIDRLDQMPQYALDLYSWMEENTDNDGQQDAMIDVSMADFDGYGLLHEVTSFSGSVPFEVPEGSDNAIIEQTGKAAIKEETEALKAQSRAMMVAVDNAFDRDHPEVFWLGKGSQTVSSMSTKIVKDSSGWVITYNLTMYYALQLQNFDIRADKYKKLEVLKPAISQRDTLVDVILSGMPSESTMYEKVQYFNKWLTKNNCYNTSSNLNTIDSDCRTCMSALVGKSGTEGPVCEGYARAMKVLCDQVGIPCVLVDGDSEGEPHMWNYIQQDDRKWYAVDSTWNDPSISGVTGKVSGYENEDYLLVGGDTVIDGKTFLQTHVVENKVSDSGPAFINGPVLASQAYVPGGIGAEPTDPTTAPTTEPTTAPTTEPTTAPTTEPTTAPTTEPTTAPTTEPTTAPTTEPTTAPTTEPTTAPTTEPTTASTTEPTTAPTAEPTTAPTTEPTTAPTTEPTEPEPQLPSIAGKWQTDVVFPAAGMGVVAPDSVLRATMTFGEDGKSSVTWEAMDLTAIKEYFHQMFVNAYYACAYGAGMTNLEDIERLCMESSGMSVSDYMYKFMEPYDMKAMFTPASTSGSYTYNDDHTAIYTDMPIMEAASDPAVPNAIKVEGKTMTLDAASYGKPEYTFSCFREGTAPQPTEPEVDDSQQVAMEQKVIELVNDLRIGFGLEPLTYDVDLGALARMKSEDMMKNEYFDHVSPTYGNPGQMLDQFQISYKFAGENIAMGMDTSEEVVSAWMQSEGHSANILDPDFTHIGVGFEPTLRIWTQIFVGK